MCIRDSPTTQRRPKGPEAVLVETTPVEMETRQIVIRAMGRVVPANQIQLAARVSGQITGTHAHFVPGGRFAAGQKILQIDPADYELIVRQQTGNLTRMESDVRLEMGQQTVAKQEYELLLEEVDEADADLLLRQPQLAAKRASVEVARATLEKARLDLDRTEIKAPFNSVVQNRNVELGSYVSPGASLATLVGTDEFWLEAAVPLDELKWIDFPDESDAAGSRARVYNESAWGGHVHREGRVIKLLPGLESKGRMAQVLIAVADPLGDNETGQPPLLLDSYVRVEIDGACVDNVAHVPRSALHGGARVWVMLPDNTLDIREVDIVWGSAEFVYVINGLRDGEQLVTSNLASPLPGMLLRTKDMPWGPTSPKRERKTDGAAA